MVTRMDRLAGTLADVDELLQAADDQTVDEALARGEAPDHSRVDDRCPFCPHGFHGLACYPPPQYTGNFLLGGIDDAALQVTEIQGWWSCRCDNSLTRRDDTWRPALSHGDRKLYEHMDRTGLDGWAAHADLERGRFMVWHALEAIVDTLVDQVGDGLMALGDAILIGRRGGFFIGPPGTPPPVEAPPSPRGHTPTHVAIDEAIALALADPLTPQARALRLRQTRNTGPERPPAGRAHRPRRHGNGGR